MRIDLYTKAILTVIAACLAWDVLNDVMPRVNAQNRTAALTPVVIVDAQGVPLVGPQGLRVNFGGQSVPVQVNNPHLAVNLGDQAIPVALTSIERRGIWQSIQVDVKRQPPTLMPTY